MRGEYGGQAVRVGSELVVPDLFDLVADGQVFGSLQLKGLLERSSFVVNL